MILGINALNTGSGGGMSSIVFLLKDEAWKRHGFSKIVVYAHSELADRIGSHPDLEIVVPQKSGRWARFRWAYSEMPKHLKQSAVDLVFLPSGYGPRENLPSILAFQNQLPFDGRSLGLFSIFDPLRWKMALLKQLISRDLRHSQGAVFLTSDSLRRVQERTHFLPSSLRVVPLGLEQRFFQTKVHRDLKAQILVTYVSTIFPYKHHSRAIRAIHRLRQQGLPVELQMVGGGPQRYVRKLQKEMKRWDPQGQYLHYRGSVEFSQMPEIYRKTDIFLYASSCETFGAILLEAMAAELPIVSSNVGPMQDMLGEAGVYFDPFSEESLVSGLKQMIEFSPVERKKLGENAALRARKFSWTTYADEMFSFFKSVGEKSRRSPPTH